jgi:octaprenyl-diphosphate synthase
MNAPAMETAVLEPLAEVASEVGATDLASQLLSMRQWMAVDLQELEGQLRSLEGLSREPEAAKSAAQYLLESGGKRVRPLIVLLASRLGAPVSGDQVRDLAVTCELIHAATLLHDDVIDEGDERRGQPTARRVYSNSASILGGDHLLIEALRLVQQSGPPQLLESLLDTISDIITAEALQLEWRGRFEPNRSLYLQVIRGKTAVLFRWGFEAGSTLAGLSAEQIGNLKEAGMALGEAFQLIDDVLDLEGESSQTGKALFTDLREGKLTWPLILAAEQDPGFVDQVRECMSDEGGLDSQTAVVQTLRRCGALEATRRLAGERVAFAQDQLRTLPRSRAREALELLAQTVVERKG